MDLGAKENKQNCDDKVAYNKKQIEEMRKKSLQNVNMQLSLMKFT